MYINPHMVKLMCIALMKERGHLINIIVFLLFSSIIAFNKRLYT